ncbi:MAG: hypothetical protein WBG08_14500 [Litorimonas sp.]
MSGGPDDLDALFRGSDVPAPRADLSDRIAQAALALEAPNAANDPHPVRRPVFWGALAGIAATLVAGALVLVNQPSEAELWAAQAETAGFGDLYEWVGADLQ